MMFVIGRRNLRKSLTPAVARLLVCGLLGFLQRAPAASPDPFILVLGICQDGGSPQAGTPPGEVWDPAKRQKVVSLGLVDPSSGDRWIFDIGPDFKSQLLELDKIRPPQGSPPLSGVFLTHAHIGHYLGLAQLGHEVMGARGVPVHAMPRMGDFLSTNGPWDQLIRYGNISLRRLNDRQEVRLNARLVVTPLLVPHRQEYSEVVGFKIAGPNKSILYLPDIDSWEDLDRSGSRIEEWITQVDVAYLDGTFFAHDEIPGRDMSGFPHPTISHSLERFSTLPESERAKIRFIHLNHTNPALDRNSPESRRIEAAGFRIARQGERVGL